jgi:creatinine amidohydrolase
MKYIQKSVLVIFLVSALAAKTHAESNQPSMSVQYKELTAPDFIRAVQEAQSTCLIPLGVLEKHGPHLPLGTDMIDIREIALRAAKKEYAIVFPEYYFGQIHEAKHQPGTLAYSSELIWNVLDETCKELARNGLKKIILVNGHGGNNNFLRYFCQSQLESAKDYAVILFTPETPAELVKELEGMRKTTTGGHADKVETSMMLAHRSDLVKLEKARDQSGKDQQRLDHLEHGYTGIWWYAKYPNHYAGDGSPARAKIGERVLNNRVEQLVELIKTVKSDEKILQLQKRFFEESKHPIKTKQ